MLTGIIEQSRYPKQMLPLVVQGKRTDLKFLVDTGFDGEVALSYDRADHFDLEILQLLMPAASLSKNSWREEQLFGLGKNMRFASFFPMTKSLLSARNCSRVA